MKCLLEYFSFIISQPSLKFTIFLSLLTQNTSLTLLTLAVCWTHITMYLVNMAKLATSLSEHPTSMQMVVGFDSHYGLRFIL